MFLFFFFKQKTAYEMRISDWSSDVCSSDLHAMRGHRAPAVAAGPEIRSRQQTCRTHRLDRDAGRARRPKPLDGLPCRSAPHSACGPRKAFRSEERRVGQECVRTCRSRWSPCHYKTKQTNTD